MFSVILCHVEAGLLNTATRKLVKVEKIKEKRKNYRVLEISNLNETKLYPVIFGLR